MFRMLLRLVYRTCSCSLWHFGQQTRHWSLFLIHVVLQVLAMPQVLSLLCVFCNFLCNFVKPVKFVFKINFANKFEKISVIVKWFTEYPLCLQPAVLQTAPTTACLRGWRLDCKSKCNTCSCATRKGVMHNVLHLLEFRDKKGSFGLALTLCVSAVFLANYSCQNHHDKNCYWHATG